MRTSLACIFVVLLFAHPVDAASEAQRCADGARDGGVAACLAAVAAEPGEIAARRHLAFAHLARNDHEACLAVHREIVMLSPDDAGAWFDYAAAAATFWNYDAAVAPIRAALRLAPDDRAVLRVAAIVFRMAGLPRDALAAMNRGSELGDDVQMAALADAYRRGDGTAPDIDASLLWLTRAAAQGHVGTMEELARLYRYGAAGVPADQVAAASWSERARRAAAGD